MKKAIVGGMLLVMLGGAFLLGSWSTRRAVPQPNPLNARKVLYYVDPMHPAYTSDRPGIAPDCGMELVPVYEDGTTDGAGTQASKPLSGAVSVSAASQQLIGVRVATVEKVSGRHTLRVLGRIVPDETRVYRINAATDGWIKKDSAATTNSQVRQDELLGTFYAPEFFSAMKAYLYGLRSVERFEATRKEPKEQSEVAGANTENYRTALRNLGMTEHQLDDIQQSRRGADQVEIRAPAAGFVLIRNISPGQRFEKGTELFRIADLARVWILAETFETDPVAFTPGLPVRVSAPHLHHVFTARVAAVPPKFDPASRTLQIRLEADNPGSLLRPDMFVDVELPVSFPAAVVVPAEAVLDSGRTRRVFVERGEGIFEPREVETGWRAGDNVEIRAGLKEGERIVVSGTFLLDSESRMKTAAAGSTGPMPEGRAHPAVAAADTAATPVARAFAAAKDPSCGMDVDIAKATAAGLTVEYQAKSYYFSSLDCRQKFASDPDRYVMPSANPAGHHGSHQHGGQPS